MSELKEYSWMTKDKLMTYTFIALVIIAAVTAAIWWPVTYKDVIPVVWPYNDWSLGLTLTVTCVIAVVIAVVLDFLLSLVMKDKGPLNTMSAAVFGLIVALSYSLGIPAVVTVEVLPLVAAEAFIYVAVISAVGIVFFKKLQGLLGRKYVNPAAAAKLLVLLPFLHHILIPQDHVTYIPTLAAPISYEAGWMSFASYLLSCFGNPALLMQLVNPPSSASDLLWTMLVAKYHGWPGGASSLTVIIVGICFLIVARRYVKWRITLSYLVTIAAMSLIMTGAYGGDILLRLMFHLFIGSSIFLAFFMATDPATTPLTYRGQYIFGLGLGVLTVLIQTYMNFLGGSILALIIMNLTSPLLDNVGLQKPIEEKVEMKLPKGKRFKTVKTTSCIRCGACMVICCHKLSPILIKEAFDKGNIEVLKYLRADLCEGCGDCNFVCPARIDLKGFHTHSWSRD